MIIRIFLFLALAFAGLSASPSVSFAQEQTGPNYEQWENVASRAEEVIEAGEASNAALEQLRAQLAVWREGFLTAQTANQTRIETLQSQLAALGPAPEEGQTEEPEIAERRAALNQQLARLRAPVTAAEEAYTRANGLITEIDNIIRERQAADLLRAGPTPVNPAVWIEGVETVAETAARIRDEVRRAWLTPGQRSELRERGPIAVFFLIFALVLLLRGRLWMERLATRFSGRGQGVWSFLISFGQIIIPMVGIFALVNLIYASGIVGIRGDVIVGQLPEMVLIFFAARWLSMRAFPRNDREQKLFKLDTAQRRKMRLNIAGFGVLLALAMLFNALGDSARYSESTKTALIFPLIVISAFFLYRTARLLRQHLKTDNETEEDVSFFDRLLSLLTKALVTVSVISVLLGIFGYMLAAESLMFSTVMTLALMVFVAILQQQIGNVYVLISGRGEDGRDSLTPVLIGFALALASAPILALIWGARVADLTELWTQFREGLVIGETRISPNDFLLFILVFAIGFTITRLLQGTLRTAVLPKTKIDIGGRNAIVSGLGYLGVFIAALLAISSTGLDLSSLAVVAGALSVGIGFGLQNIVSNFISGIILLIERPISEGDWIEVGGQMGYVRSISVRSTRIETFDRTDVIVPNADLISNQVTNWTRGNSVGRVIVPVGVAYGTDTKKVEEILTEIARAHPMVLLNPAPSILFMAFGADSLNFEIRAILRDVNWKLSVLSEMNHQIAQRFAEEGIEIPFAQRDIWLRNPEALQQPSAPPTRAKKKRASGQPDTPEVDDPDSSDD
ncbi:DUF3772 domain-containing protein [Pseudaestuariivita rosea]|uniref:DUF3772 domain-containing protein n=1 Tax=Pseudaestuariivita rosea TaxID=2763263 RepID=UPI001ABAA09F|nr:DUF3772 domain-containing protein [Pseudaestuariivita rosea]